MAKAIQLVESAGHEHGVNFPMQGTVAVSDGITVWAFRYYSQRPRGSPSPATMRRHPGLPHRSGVRRLWPRWSTVAIEPGLEGWTGPARDAWSLMPPRFYWLEFQAISKR